MRRDFALGFRAFLGYGRAPVTWATTLGWLCALASVVAGSVGVAYALYAAATLGRALGGAGLP